MQHRLAFAVGARPVVRGATAGRSAFFRDNLAESESALRAALGTAYARNLAAFADREHDVSSLFPAHFA